MTSLMMTIFVVVRCLLWFRGCCSHRTHVVEICRVNRHNRSIEYSSGRQKQSTGAYVNRFKDYDYDYTSSSVRIRRL